ncbi:flagellar hook protein FlgE [Pseudooceanicola antarcticus]|uniref:Flagellar hook protein FlgE n=1 Tax=Pseudooceanicola antarcticus TaxID=1247613 RepID=A0A285HUL7_9RHOB|nr:flagellar hook-basal body complex protein [Pseudooceanicola antarcticus]PJE27487.1 flagellar biosynthesis protein FlgE [Pseudooceanicola antarcticus]SNY39395.1 flagellar hook protein FlgE [Pseudooceanicola antarcticus]
MTISSSLNAGVAGLQTNATRLAAIADNIANSSTFGYKKVSTDFSSLVLSESGAGYTAGGVRATTMRQIDQRRSIVPTDNPTDLAVRERGMLPVAYGAEVAATGTFEQMLLTSTGSFRTDEDGYLRTDTGLILLGWEANSDGSIPAVARETSTGLVPVQIDPSAYAGNPTTEVSMGVNLPATETEDTASGDPLSVTIEYYDNLGKPETLTVTFTPDVAGPGASNSWQMVIDDSALGTTVGDYTLDFNDTRTEGGTLDAVTLGAAGTAYDAVTGKVTVTVASGPIEIDLGLLDESGGLSQLGDKFAPTGITKDGSAVSNITGVEVDGNGYVRAFFESGAAQVLYQVPLADVVNVNGMKSMDYQTYMPTPESGGFYLWNAGDGPTGDIVSYAREESGTDVAGELTDMIRTQRAYSSNAKVFQTVDEMLQETTNIKR